jgi:ADP-ribosylglycohydrolase
MVVYARVASRYGVDPNDDHAVDKFFERDLPQLSAKMQQAVFEELLAADVQFLASERDLSMSVIEPWLTNFMVGDAYGAGFEFAPREQIERFNDGITYRKHGLDPHHKPGGTTDDTQMTFAVKHIVDIGLGTRAVSFANEFCEVYKNHPAPAYGSRMQELLPEAAKRPEPGKFLMESCRSLGKDKCGAAMRAIPCGSNQGDFYGVVLSAITQARVTHHHPDSIDAAVLIALAAFQPDPDGWRAAAHYVGWPSPEIWNRETWDRSTTRGKDIAQAVLGLLWRLDTLHELLVGAVALGGDVDTVAALCLGLGTLAGRKDDLSPRLREGLIVPQEILNRTF